MRALAIAVVLIVVLIVAASVPLAVSTAEKSVFMNSNFSIYFRKSDAQNFWDTYGMLLNGSEFTVEVLITPTNYSKELGNTELHIESYFIDKGVEPAILIDGRNVEYRNPLPINPENINEIKILLTAEAVNNVKMRMPITLIKITQRTSEDEYMIENRETNVSSWLIEEAIKYMEDAKQKIKEAEKIVSGLVNAERELENARSQLSHAENLYMQGKPEKALEEAKSALENAKIAVESARSSRSMGDVMRYVLAAVVLLIVAVAAFVWFRKRQRERGKLG